MGEQAEEQSGTATRQELSRLILTGFMGAGKSTVGAILASILGWRFVDLDSFIEASLACTVAEIFRNHGEAYFRSRERWALEELSGESHVVLALGGGTIEDQANLSYLLGWEGTCTVFLDAPFPELLERVRGAEQTRPLWAAVDDLEARLNRRMPLYRSAHITVATAGQEPGQVADHVLERVGQRWRIDPEASRGSSQDQGE